MKQLFLIHILMLCYCTSAVARTVNEDSLIHIARTTTDKKLKANTYRNLADIYIEKPQEPYYLNLLYQAAKDANDKELALNALTDLSYANMEKGRTDSVYYCMNLIKKEAGAEKANKYLSIIRMKLFYARTHRDKKEAEEAINFEQDLMKNADNSNIYIQIERTYISGNNQIEFHNYEAASKLFKEAYKLTGKLTDPNDIRYRLTIGWVYANNMLNIGRAETCIELLEGILDLYKSNYENIIAEKRPYYKIEKDYLKCYASLLMHAKVLSKEKLNLYISEIQKIGARATEITDQYNYLLAMCNYYLFIKDYPKALEIIDRQIKILPKLSPTFLPFKLKLQSDIYEEMGDYHNALKKYKIHIQMKDSFASQEREEQLNKLQVEYEVDKLKFEKTNLESKNKMILLIALSIILLLTIAACIYFYTNLRREKQMKMKLYLLNQKAGESERMKTEFINSMCHEIRTPLNSIVGFSGIIVDDDYDNEAKIEFAELISSNTALLTSLVDDLLVVSNLDSSSDLLPCEASNISDLCREEFEKARCKNQKPIEYLLDIPKEDITFPTNAKHLSLVLEKLLNNANKFTQQGHISLMLQHDESTNTILLQVSDTGCGIPPDKHEIVFERFMKLDTFVQGNGIGLFLSRLIISRLKGSIRIDPSYTDGARFIIALPMQ